LRVVVVNPDEWSSQAKVAAAFGVSSSAVQKWINEGGCPGADNTYPVNAICQWREGYWRDRVAAASGDPILASDGESDVKERYTLAMARLREMDLEERQRNLLDRDTMMSGFMEGVAVLRNACERLQLECEPLAFEIMDEALQQVIKKVGERFSDSSGLDSE
jgi:hypothetical protein